MPADDDRLESLTDAWEARCDEGDEPDLETFCPDPSLRAQLAERIAALRPFRPIPQADVVPAVPGYTGLEEIGHGGMGVVYKAVQVTLNRVVALKMVTRSDALSGKTLARFLAEAEAVATIDHPQVVRIYDSGRAGGWPYLAMEYLPGGTLEQKLKALGGPMPPRTAAHLLVHIAQGVQAVHDHQIVHRDLKPGNVLFNAVGEPKVADFGLAKRTGGSSVTDTHIIMGTPAYMAPEQAKGESKFVGPAADVWALGVILYECLAGRRPFSGADTQTLLQQIIMDEPLRVMPRGRDRDLGIICHTCLQKDPRRRYVSAQSLIQDLERYLKHEPISARSPRMDERVRSWSRRHPLQAMAVGIAFVVVAGSAWAWSSHVARVRDERAVAAVEQLVTTDPQGLDRVLRELDAGNADRLLESAAAAGAKATKRRCELALLPRHSELCDRVIENLLECPSEEFPIILERLAPHSATLMDRFWQNLANPSLGDDAVVRMACALSHFDPHNLAWVSLAPVLHDRLIMAPRSLQSAWTRLLTPVSGHLQPLLLASFHGDSDDTRRTSAVALIVELETIAAEPLAKMLLQATPPQIAELMPLAGRHQAALVPLLVAAMQTPIMPKPVGDFSAWETEKIAPVHARRARAALALWHLGDHAAMRHTLRDAADPQTQSYLVHWLAESRYPLRSLIAVLEQERESGIRKALVYAIGEYSMSALRPPERELLRVQLLSLYERDLDSGVHSAVRWLLQRWGWEDDVRARDTRLRRVAPLAASGWYSSLNSHTFAVVRGPVTLESGTSQNAHARSPWEEFRTFTIDRDYAIGTTELTVAQYRAWSQTFIGAQLGEGYSPLPECPAGFMNFGSILDYCRWLTTQAGMSEDDQCYGPVEWVDQFGCRDYPDALLRRGFRLPTEAEWEYAARAGTTSSRYWGEDSGPFARHYAASANDHFDRNQIVAGRKANNLGLFDVLGNSWEWCHDYGGSEVGSVRRGPRGFANPDWGGALRFQHLTGIVRGMSFTNRSSDIHVNHRRFHYSHGNSFGDFGVRIARTLRSPEAAWRVTLYPTPKFPQPPNEPEWNVLLQSRPLRITRMTHLHFYYEDPAHDSDFALVAEKTHDGPAGDYRLTFAADDGVRIRVDGREIVNRWVFQNGPEESVTVALKPGSIIRVEYWQGASSHRLKVALTPKPQNDLKESPPLHSPNLPSPR